LTQSQFHDAWQTALSKLPEDTHAKYAQSYPNHLLTEDDRCLSRLHLDIDTQTLKIKNYDKCAIADAEGKSVDEICFPYITGSKSFRQLAKCAHLKQRSAHSLSHNTFQRLLKSDSRFVTFTDLN